MKKAHTIYFYDLHSQRPNATIADILNYCFDNGIGLYEFNFDDKKYCFEILEKSDEYFFGKLSRDDDFKESLTAIKTKIGERPLNPNDYIFEKFTFFYIKLNPDNLSHSQLSVINNIGLNIESCFNIYFSSKMGMIPLFIVPMLMPDINKKINDLKSIKFVECTFSDTTTANNQTNFNNIFNSKCFFKGVKMRLTFREKKPNVNEIFLDAMRYKQFKVVGKNQNDKEETIDFIKKLLIKKSNIEMKDISINNFEPIKKALNDFSTL